MDKDRRTTLPVPSCQNVRNWWGRFIVRGLSSWRVQGRESINAVWYRLEISCAILGPLYRSFGVGPSRRQADFELLDGLGETFYEFRLPLVGKLIACISLVYIKWYPMRRFSAQADRSVGPIKELLTCIPFLSTPLWEEIGCGSHALPKSEWVIIRHHCWRLVTLVKFPNFSFHLLASDLDGSSYDSSSCFRFRVVVRSSVKASTSPFSLDFKPTELIDCYLAGLTSDAVLLPWWVDIVDRNTMLATSRLLTPRKFFTTF